MNSLDAELQQRLAALRAQGLARELRRVDSPQGPRLRLNGRELLNFSSNDYLGLSNHPALVEAAARAVKDFGAGAGASRLVCGSLAPFHELEEALAAFKSTEAALTFSTGYAAALGAITALLGPDDVLLTDKLVHACVVDAARLCRAKLRIFAHNDLNDLEDKLKWADSRKIGRVTLIVTESIFSMEGDAAPLREIVALKERYGAWLMVDEAHATGLYGANRRGLAEELGVSDRIEVQMGTLGKALGASGGHICGSRALIDLLVNRARSFIFSTAPVPATAAAARAGIELVRSSKGRELNERLRARVAECRTGVAPFSLSGSALLGNGIGNRRDDCLIRSAILPIILGDEAAAVAAATRLREAGLLVPAIRYPTVARGAARLRVTLTALHSSLDVAALTAALGNLKPGIPNLSSP